MGTESKGFESSRLYAKSVLLTDIENAQKEALRPLRSRSPILSPPKHPNGIK